MKTSLSHLPEAMQANERKIQAALSFTNNY